MLFVNSTASITRLHDSPSAPVFSILIYLHYVSLSALDILFTKLFLSCLFLKWILHFTIVQSNKVLKICLQVERIFYIRNSCHHFITEIFHQTINIESLPKSLEKFNKSNIRIDIKNLEQWIFTSWIERVAKLTYIYRVNCFVQLNFIYSFYFYSFGLRYIIWTLIKIVIKFERCWVGRASNYSTCIWFLHFFKLSIIFHS